MRDSEFVALARRGSGAAAKSLNVPGTKLVAMADAFANNIEDAFKNLKGQFGDRVDVPQERRFSGFDAYKNAIDSADVVLLCTPPGFRPAHFEYAVQQGKHVFMEKPAAANSESHSCFPSAHVTTPQRLHPATHRPLPRRKTGQLQHLPPAPPQASPPLWIESSGSIQRPAE